MIIKALQKASEFNEISNIPWIRQLFERVQRIPGANQLFKRIASAPDSNQYADYFAEVIYALVFAGLGFDVAIEPLGSKGPDMEVRRDGHHAVVEVTRFRNIFPGPPEININDSILPDYGNPQRDVRKSFGKLLSKFRQVGDNPSIIAIWNDDGDLEEVEVETAVNDLRNNAAQHTLVPTGLLFILYASQWVRLPSHYKQIYCFPMNGSEHHQSLWQHELSNSTFKQLFLRAIQE